MVKGILLVILDISTILGGLSALVFLYDRFGPVKAQAARPQRVPSLSRGLYSRPISLAITAHCLVSALIASWISYKFGWQYLMAFAFLGGLPSWGLSALLDSKTNDGLDVVFLFGATFTIMGALLSCLAGMFLYYLNTDDANLVGYAGSSSSIVAGIFCILEAIVFSYLISR